MKRLKVAVMWAVVIGLSGCSAVYDNAHVEYEAVKPARFPVIRAVGYAPIDDQPGATQTEKMLNAIKASKLDAYRELAQQVHGQQLSGSLSVSGSSVQSSRLEGSVDGVIRGARVVQSYPVDDKVYATELELDMEQVYLLYQATMMPTRVKSVRYY